MEFYSRDPEPQQEPGGSGDTGEEVQNASEKEYNYA